MDLKRRPSSPSNAVWDSTSGLAGDGTSASVNLPGSSSQTSQPDLDDASASEMLASDLARASWPTFDEFTVLAVLGSGSFGTVYKCRSNSDRRLVAIKVPRDTDAAVALFERELSLLVRLPEHRHVVRVLRATKAHLHTPSPAGHTVPAVVVDWIPNARPIDDYCEHHKLSRRAKLHLLAQVASGLDHLHMHGVLHLDLKPRNVLVSEDGTAVIVDLGGARERLNAAEASSVMTIAYASPEQLDGSDPELIDQRSDMYSFGRLMGALLLGGSVNSLPTGATQAEAVQAMRAWKVAEYRTRSTWPGGEVGQLIETLLARDRRTRDLRAIDVARRLQRIAEPPLLRGAREVLTLLGHRFTRNAAVLAASSVLAIAVTAFLASAYAHAGVGPALSVRARAPMAMNDVFIVSLDDAMTVERADGGVHPAASALERANRRRHLFAKILLQAHRGGASTTVIDAMLPAREGLESGTLAVRDALLATSAEMPTVLAVSGRWTTSTDESVVAPELAPLVAGLGGIDADLNEGVGVLVPVVMLREGRSPAPHLAAVAVAAHLRATLTVETAWSGLMTSSVRFLAPWEASADRESRSAPLDLVKPTTPRDRELYSPGLAPGDGIGLIALDPAAIQSLGTQRTMSVDKFLTLDDVALAAAVERRIVLVWNGEEGNDRIEVAPGMVVPGGWIPAVAMQSLLQGSAGASTAEGVLLGVIAAAVLGAVLGMAFVHTATGAQRKRALVPLIVFAAGVGIGVLLLLTSELRGIDFRVAFLLVTFIVGAAVAASFQWLRALVPEHLPHIQLAKP